MAQPYMGPRRLVAVRPSAEIASAFEAELAETGMKCSELLADIAATRYGLPLPSERVRRKRDRRIAAQQELPGQQRPTQLSREPRDHYGTRLPVDVFDCLAAEAKAAETPYGVLLCEILAERYSLPVSTRNAVREPRPTQGVLRLSSIEEVSPLSRAS